MWDARRDLLHDAVEIIVALLLEYLVQLPIPSFNSFAIFGVNKRNTLHLRGRGGDMFWSPPWMMDWSRKEGISDVCNVNSFSEYGI